jgi:hypothetical protein
MTFTKGNTFIIGIFLQLGIGRRALTCKFTLCGSRYCTGTTGFIFATRRFFRRVYWLKEIRVDNAKAHAYQFSSLWLQFYSSPCSTLSPLAHVMHPLNDCSTYKHVRVNQMGITTHSQWHIEHVLCSFLECILLAELLVQSLQLKRPDRADE